jgi:hypothetical protein
MASLGRAIGYAAGELGYFRQPPAVIFLFGFKGKVHRRSIAWIASKRQCLDIIFKP